MFLMKLWLVSSGHQPEFANFAHFLSWKLIKHILQTGSWSKKTIRKNTKENDQKKNCNFLKKNRNRFSSKQQKHLRVKSALTQMQLNLEKK